MEDYRQGYPQLAAFLSLDRNFSMLKRFDYLHMRCLLDSQDQLSELESKINHCDDVELTQFNLASRRQDVNAERRQLLESIRAKMDTYNA